jgi:sugar lactone lactonase YvrE
VEDCSFMNQVKAILTISLFAVVTLSLSSCGGSSGNAISAPPVGSGTVQYVASASFSGSGTGAGQFTYPAGLTYASNGNVVVADYGNGRVEVFSSTGTYIAEFGTGQMQSPSDVTISNGNYFVTDPASNAVFEFDQNYNYVTKLTTTAPEGFVKPTSITADPSGNLYVGQSGAILVFNSAGVYQTQITSIGGNPLPSLIVAGLAADNSGNLYALDPVSATTIDYFTPTGAIVTKIPITGVPYSIATDGNGNVFYTDLTNHQIQEYNSAGVLQSTCVTSIDSQGLAVSSTDRLTTSVGISPGGYIAVYKIKGT